MLIQEETKGQPEKINIKNECVSYLLIKVSIKIDKIFSDVENSYCVTKSFLL